MGDLDIDPADVVVIVGGAESAVRILPHPIRDGGRQRTVGRRRASNSLGPLDFSPGRMIHPGWYDAGSGDLVPEEEIVERYHDAVVERCGIREFVADGALEADHATELLVSVFLDRDFSFVVSSEAEARAFEHADPDHTVVRPVPDPAIGR